MAIGAELERIARDCRHWANISDDIVFVDVVALVARHLGPHAIAEDATLTRDAYVRARSGGYQLILRSSWNVRVPAATALGQHLLRKTALSFDERVAAAPRVGRAILASPVAVRACRERGMRIPALSAALGLPREVVGLRLCDLGRPPLAVPVRPRVAKAV